jgi:hypothetical protein
MELTSMGVSVARALGAALLLQPVWPAASKSVLDPVAWRKSPAGAPAGALNDVPAKRRGHPGTAVAANATRSRLTAPRSAPADEWSSSHTTDKVVDDLDLPYGISPPSALSHCAGHALTATPPRNLT